MDVKKAECQRIDAFELWCWRRLLRVPWIARRSNQSILKEVSSGCSLEGPMLKLKIQYFGHLMWRVDSLEKTLMLGGIRGRGGGNDRGWDCWLASPTQWTWVWVNSGRWWWTGRPGVLRFMGLQTVGHDWATELNWTELVHSPQHVQQFLWGSISSSVKQDDNPSYIAWQQGWDLMLKNDIYLLTNLNQNDRKQMFFEV